MTTHRIAVIGGTGPQGKGLGYRFARAGHDVVLGSRTRDRGEAAAAEVRDRMASGGTVTGADNVSACEGADVVVLAIPYDGHDELVASLPLDGTVVVSCVNPLAFDKAGPHGRVVDGGEGSAAESAQRLAPGAHVVGAFHHVSAVSLWGERDLLDDEDVLVCGDSAEAKQVVMDLAAAVTGRTGVDAGRLRLARQLEPLTAVLISINKTYKTHSGIRVAGLGT
ncbi:NADPH-dependent F420 reductase [Nocardioides hwasunensis]|uniref:NADPH-dependent F420 reductase n=1 Tax=Nocardioides hwasunensis TaxID=397258 RepID=A0ABR8MI24_9ACTN|nr:NADPH-dependent F420 reductase [Nocardioides hwasunensis]MBD3915638.1 NADPH-dependent F420 reductase [Nocardioides hwasunensis]